MLDLSQFTGTEAYHKLGLGVFLSDGTQYVAEQLGAFWLFQETGIYLRGYQTVDEFQVVKLEKIGKGFQVAAGDGNGDWRTLFSGEFTSFPDDMMPFEFYAQWLPQLRGWLCFLKSEY